jgi:Protein phosphatase 2C
VIPRWYVAGTSVRGDAHRRRGTPNQDAILILPGDHGGPLVAIADGHGSERSFRSDVGARLAVTTAARCVRRLKPAMKAAADTPGIERLVVDLAREIVVTWRALATSDLEARPFTVEELTGLGVAGQDATDQLRSEPLIAYGATLLLTAVIAQRLIMLQIGDGDILRVTLDDDHPIVVRPIPSDDRLVGNVTTSLCVAGAERDFRADVRELARPDHAELVIMTTDGYANSFVDDAAFLQAGPDVLDLLQEHGIDWVGEQLPGWLETASREGSGDDITMAILWREPGGPGRRSGHAAAEAASTDVPAELSPSTAHPVTKQSSRSLASRVIPVAIGFTLGTLLGWLMLGESGSRAGDEGGVASVTSPTFATGNRTTWTWGGGIELVELLRGDPTGRRIDVPELRGRGPVRDVEAGFGAVWIAVEEDALIRVDDPTNEVDVIELGDEPAGISIGHRQVFVFSASGNVLHIVTPEPPFEMSTMELDDPLAGRGGSPSPPSSNDWDGSG